MCENTGAEDSKSSRVQHVELVTVTQLLPWDHGLKAVGETPNQPGFCPKLLLCVTKFVGKNLSGCIFTRSSHDVDTVHMGLVVTTGWTNGVRSSAGTVILLFATISRPTQGPIRNPIRGVEGSCRRE